jgi:hypothetical protein
MRGSVTDTYSELVRERYRLATAVHGGIGVGVEEFEQHLNRIAHRQRDPKLFGESLTSFVKSLHTNDLLLSMSCGIGKDAGWQRFSALYRKYVSDLSRRFLDRVAGLEELGETIWIDLCLLDKSGQKQDRLL